MKVLVINCGSSSLKYQLIDMKDEKILCKGKFAEIGQNDTEFHHKTFENKKTRTKMCEFCQAKILVQCCFCF